MDIVSTNSSLLLYQTGDGQTKIEVRLQDESVWLSQAQLCELFDKDKRTVSEHIQNIFKEGELVQESVIRKFRTSASDGKNYQVNYYNLDMIISVGYRVSSHRGTQFRIWATTRLKEYLIKGFTLDDERLKRGGGGNYFNELLSRIRDIRSSERIFGAKSSISMPQASTMTPKQRIQSNFSQLYKIRCIGRLMVIRLLKSSILEQTLRKQTWDSPLGQARSHEKLIRKLQRTISTEKN